MAEMTKQNFEAIVSKLNLNTLKLYTNPVRLSEYPLQGRKREVTAILSTFARKVISNVILLGAPGVGKTALVQGLAKKDKSRVYLEVNLSTMLVGDNGVTEAADRLRRLFEEVEIYQAEIRSQNQAQSGEIVMFIDEFHRIVSMSPLVAQEIKPILAESASRGLRILAATTFEEYDEFIAGDKALNDRLELVKIRELSKAEVIQILDNFLKANLSDDDYLKFDKKIYTKIYEYTNRYNPSSPQPRKSLYLMDRLLGYYLAFGMYPTEEMLNIALYESLGVNVNIQLDVNKFESALNHRVFDQKFAVNLISRQLQNAVSKLVESERPLSSFLFVGSTGVGKTEMAKGMTKLLYGDERLMIRFDMSEYSLAESVERFREQLAHDVWAQPYGVLLLDEIEKANPSITRLLLQVLDDGRLSDKYGREVSFKNLYILLTTNTGSEIFRAIEPYVNASDDGTTNSLGEYNAVIRSNLMESDSFPTELINRIDSVIPFVPLKEGTYYQILKRKINQIRKAAMEKHGVTLKVSADVLDYLIKDKYSTDTQSGGSRGLEHQLHFEVTSKISKFINMYPGSKELNVIVEGEAAHKNKFQRISRAYISVEDPATKIKL